MTPESSSTLWRFSEFDELYRTRSTTTAALDTLVASSLMGELGTLERRGCRSDVVEVLAACRRAQEPALVYLRVDDLVWPITVFPSEGIYHSRHDLLHAFGQGVVDLQVMAVEAPSVAPPGLRLRDGGGLVDFRPLRPALWQLVLSSPTQGLLREIGGKAAYRALRSLEAEGLQAPGAMGHAAARLRREAASLREIAQWPGMSLDRGVRLLNGLYLVSSLMVSRSHPQARPEPAMSVPGRLRGPSAS